MAASQEHQVALWGNAIVVVNRVSAILNLRLLDFEQFAEHSLLELQEVNDLLVNSAFCAGL